LIKVFAEKNLSLNKTYMDPIHVDIPRKDHSMKIRVEKMEKKPQPSYSLFYNDQLCGCMVDNENGVWIYEPHAHEALLLSAEEIQHLGKQIKEQAG